MRDLFNSINPRPVLSPVVVTDNTPQVGSIIDLQGYDSITYVIVTGTLADADATFAASLSAGNASNLSDGVAVPSTDLLGSDLLASFNFASDVKCFKIGYQGSMRYSQLTVTPSGNTGNAPLCILAILGHPALGPTSNPPS